MVKHEPELHIQAIPRAVLARALAGAASRAGGRPNRLRLGEDWAHLEGFKPPTFDP